VINLTDIAIRRLIKMSKKIYAFQDLCQEDQIALLKGGCTEMMILRSVVSYDPERDSWNVRIMKKFIRAKRVSVGVGKRLKYYKMNAIYRFLTVTDTTSSWEC
jgi:hypothetical protein